jgi:hypothetical protein
LVAGTPSFFKRFLTSCTSHQEVDGLENTEFKNKTTNPNGVLDNDRNEMPAVSDDYPAHIVTSHFRSVHIGHKTNLAKIAT